MANGRDGREADLSRAAVQSSSPAPTADASMVQERGVGGLLGRNEAEQGGCRVLLSQSEAQGQPCDDVMRVVRGFEEFRGKGWCGVLILQLGGEVREAILCERPDPFRDHDCRSGIDFDTDGRIGGVLSTRLDKRVLPRVGNEYRRAGGEVRLHASMDEFFVSQERETQAQHVKTDSPCRQAPMGELCGGSSGTGHAHLLSRRRFEVKEEHVQPESKPVHLLLVEPIPPTATGRPTVVYVEVLVGRRGSQRAGYGEVRVCGPDSSRISISIPFRCSILWIQQKPYAQCEAKKTDELSIRHDRTPSYE